MRNELFHTHTYLFIHGAGDAQGRRRHDDLQLPDQVPVLTIQSPYKKQIKICTIKTFLIKLAKVRDTLANLLENGFDTVERLRCIEASTPVRAIARAENSVGVVHPFRAESR